MFLEGWKDRISSADIAHLTGYLENVAQQTLNEKPILIIGAIGSGKTTLLRQIREYIGEQYCHETIDRMPEPDMECRLCLLDGYLNHLTGAPLVHLLKMMVSRKNIIMATKTIKNMDTDIVASSHIIVIHM